MRKITEACKNLVAEALESIASEKAIDGSGISSSLVAEIPPDPSLGDVGFPLFPFAKLFRMSPALLAAALVDKLASNPQAVEIGHIRAEGPYLNVNFKKEAVFTSILDSALNLDSSFGKPNTLSGRRIMIEFSSPNTNKPLHLGHLRNDALGESMSRILKAVGADIRKVCIINDRGVHICKSMLAKQKYYADKSPETEGVKSDRFVGDCYVKFHEWSKEDPAAEEAAREMLRKWESGDPETLTLWKTMNDWAVSGMKATYERTGVSFDQYYYESQTYLKGRDEVLKGLENGVFFKAEDGSVQIDLSNEGLDTKVLLRKDGTSIYITQDIGTAIDRQKDWAFDSLIYVVGSEQQYHFKVLFSVLEKLGFEWAKNLYHLSYGMVNLPEGKMKSREGTVVDADDLLNQLRDLALEEIRQKEREGLVGDAQAIAEKIALGALHYFLLQVSASRDMLFNPKESLSFNGNTGPYLQYMGARISSMLKKAADGGLAQGTLRPELLTDPSEWDLIKLVGRYEEALLQAAERKDPSVLASWLYELSKAFSRFYHDCPVLNASDADLATSRLAVCKAVVRVLKAAMELICVPFLETM